MDIWRYADADHIRFLDSSMLLYGKQGHIATVDFQDRRSFGTKIVGAVSHSGDIIDDEWQTGKQTMSVRLADLVRIPIPSKPYLQTQ